jgi:hypothetical protein
MDEIDRGKIGKKDEKLIGWDHIRQKKIGTTYPPMKAKGALLTPGAIRAKSNTSHRNKSSSSGIGWWLVGLLIIVIIGTKIIGIW